MYKIFKQLIYFAISILDKLEKSEFALDDTGKLVKSFRLDNMQVYTDNGWKDAGYIHQTKKFETWDIKTESFSICCADLHKFFREDLTEVFADELRVGDKILTEKGPESVVYISKSNLEICMSDITVMNGDSRYYSNGILSHNTTTSALFMLHYMLFNFDKNALVVANKLRTAVEVLDKAKKIYLELPYFLKGGVYKWNENEIVLDDGCRLMAEATTINSGIGYTYHNVLWDEAAHVQPNIMEKFYNNLFPTITAGKARFMITSTQNGYNLFSRLYMAAEAHENEYAAFKTDWYEVPEWNPDKRCWEQRDEAWHRLQVANYGSEEAFNKQFGTSFDVNSNTLIDSRIMKSRETEAIEFIRKEIPGVSAADSFYWKPDYEPTTDARNDYFVITIDISEGIGGDDTVYTFNKLFITTDNEINTETVGFFKNNTVNAEQATRILQEFCSNYMDINKYLISLEYNLYGELFAKYIMENIEKDPQRMHLFNEDVIMKYWNDEMTKYTLGKKITAKTKQMGTAMFKQYFERNKIINHSTLFLNQLRNFCDNKGNGTYQASFGHDDLVMSQLQMVYAIENPQYKSLCQMFISSQQMSICQESSSYNPYEMNYTSFSQPYIDDQSIYGNDMSIFDMDSLNNRKRLG